jgi:hypothetical protein
LPVEKTKISGCNHAYITRLPDGVEILFCQPSADDTSLLVSLRSGDKIIKKWNATVYPPLLSDKTPESDIDFPLRVDTLNSHGDDKEEFLIAVMSNESNGIGLMSWSIWAFDGTNLTESIDTEDYGVLSFPVCSRNGDNKFLLVARWLGGWEPKRGGGMYFSACWFKPQFQPDDNVWIQSSDARPSIYRRYLSGFERLRIKAIEHNTPLLWYRSPNTHIQVGPSSCQ